MSESKDPKKLAIQVTIIIFIVAILSLILGFIYHQSVTSIIIIILGLALIYKYPQILTILVIIGILWYIYLLFFQTQNPFITIPTPLGILAIIINLISGIITTFLNYFNIPQLVYISNNSQFISNSKLVYQTANWTSEVNMSGSSNCSFANTYCLTQVPVYQVSGFYYPNASAKNYTCWVTHIIKINPPPRKEILLQSNETKNVVQDLVYFNNNCMAPISNNAKYGLPINYAKYAIFPN